MKHRLFLTWTCIVGALSAGLPSSATAASPRPNIIFILADDLGLPALGCTGGAYKTPHLDALAAGGTRFENCFAAPLCGPSRATLMTGRYVFRTGVLNNGLGAQATPQKDGCVALRLKHAGYATAIAGKWRQLSHFTTKEDGAKWGFDEFLVWGAGLPDNEGSAKKAKQAIGEADARGDRYWSPDYNLNGKTLVEADNKYGPDVLHAFVADFIQRHKEGPFFVYYPTPLIHGPILATPDSDTKDKTDTQDNTAKRKAKKSGNAGEGSLYADNIAYLDKLVGKLIAELDALKLREKTLIVFVGDNGSVPIGTVHGRTVDGKKDTMLEGGSRVPLIANWPGTTRPGVVLKDLVDFSDLLPTVTELAGVPPARDEILDGQSFAPQLRGEPGRRREWVYVQLGDQRYVRSDRWKLTGEGNFFDMSDAPFSEIPVAVNTDDAAAQAARAKLQAALDDLQRQDIPNKNKPGGKRGKKKAAKMASP